MSTAVVSSVWRVAYPRRKGSWTLSGADGRWAVLDPEAHAVSVVDPAGDPTLPALARATKRGDLVGYRAGRRAVVSALGSYVKVVRPDRLASLVDTLEALDGSVQGVAIPSVRRVAIEGSVDLTPVSGVSLNESLRSRSTAAVLADLDAIGTALARFHQSSSSGAAATQRPAEEWVETVARIEPEAVERLSDLASELPPIPETTTTMVHGDLHDKNILIRDGDVGLIDLDGSGRGHPEDDIANLAVHLQLRVLQRDLDSAIGLNFAARLYEVYRRHAPLATDRLEAVERHTWFRLGCLYRYRIASRHLVPEMMRRASDLPRTASSSPV